MEATRDCSDLWGIETWLGKLLMIYRDKGDYKRLQEPLGT